MIAEGDGNADAEAFGEGDLGGERDALAGALLREEVGERGVEAGAAEEVEQGRGDVRAGRADAAGVDDAGWWRR